MALAGGGGASAVAWAPLIVAAGGLLTAIVTGFTRRDRKQTDTASNLDSRTQTAINGLSEAFDRVEAERARWQERAELAEAEATRLHQQNEELQALAYLRSRPPPKDSSSGS